VKNLDIRIGCAGWSIPKREAAAFPIEGSHLERYAARLNCVEINSSFYRPHQQTTYARWAQSVPDDFRFSVKMPREITHQARLIGVGGPLSRFLDEASALGKKLGCVLIQLPPSLQFERAIANRFLTMLRKRFDGTAVLEPRHATWFDPKADALLIQHGIGRVAADPAIVDTAAIPGGDVRCVYFRLHGSPKIYYSTYDSATLKNLAVNLRAAHASGAACWCIFDNTALGAAMPNAFDAVRLIAKP
jgi:uncharacterized protein YecE (DUF72 family)